MTWFLDIKDYKSSFERRNNWSFTNKNFKEFLENNEKIKEIRKSLMRKRIQK